MHANISKSDQAWLARFEAYVEQHLKETELTVSHLSTEFFMSESTLLRTLKRLTGLSPAQYLKEIRLNRARFLLERGEVRSIGEVTSEVGYGSPRSFARSFKKRYGITPSQLVPD
ncbi:MAG: helix-turn-helix transcriptional regulator [Bacteroidota bacterium]